MKVLSLIKRTSKTLEELIEFTISIGKSNFI